MAPRALALTLPLLLWLAACPGRPPGSKRAAPPDIRTRCVLVDDGAMCTFGNAGGDGERCVEVLLGVHATAAVSSSEKLCSGTLSLGVSARGVARFSVRPASACGAGLSGCTLRVVEVGTAAAAGEAWAADLRAAPTSPPTEAMCGQLLDHVLGLQLVEETSHLEGERRSARQAEIRDSLEAWRSQLREDCRDGMTRKEVECALAATTLEELRPCAP